MPDGSGDGPRLSDIYDVADEVDSWLNDLEEVLYCSRLPTTGHRESGGVTFELELMNGRSFRLRIEEV